MKHRTVSALSVRASLLVAVGFLALPVMAELPSYQFINLGTLGGPSSLAYAINNAGWVTGWAQPDPSVGQNGHPFLWDGSTMKDLSIGASQDYWDEGEPTDINAIGQVAGQYNYRMFLWDGATMRVGELGRGAAINDSGQVAGRYLSPDGNHAVIWDGATMTDLGVLLGNTSSEATGINNSGQVVGFFEYFVGGSGSGRAFLWDGSILHDLPRLGGTWSYAADINDSGQVVGNAYVTGNTALHAVMWEGGAIHDLGTLGGRSSGASRITDSGLVLGNAETADGVSHPFIWDGTTMQNLGALEGDVCSAYDINEQGQAVGHCQRVPYDGTLRSFLWDGTRLQNLAGLVNGVVADSVSALAISDSGQIVGYFRVANVADGPTAAFLATPISNLFADLLADSTGIGPDRKLPKRLTLAQAYYEADDLQAMCSQLVDFNSQVQKLAHAKMKKLTGKKISQDQAGYLTGQSQAIMDAVGCP